MKEELIKYLRENYLIKSYDQLSEETGESKTKLQSLVYRHIPERYGVGKSPFSYRSKRKFNLNDDCFSIQTNESCYWAGFFAADGCVAKQNSLSISLKKDDYEHLLLFKEFLGFQGEVKTGVSKYFYKGKMSLKEYCLVSFTSEKIKKDLNKNFNITERKSLTLKPPNIKDKKKIDSYIAGYIDGDGSIFFSKSKRQKKLVISLLGTFENMDWIRKRFLEILGEGSLNLYQKEPSEKNSWILTVSDKRARKLYLHFFSIKCPKLKRKWTLEKKDHCNNYKKFRNTEVYKKIAIMLASGLSTKEVSQNLGVSYQAISWYKKQDLYKEILINMDLNILKTNLSYHPININGIFYKSKAEAARILNISWRQVKNLLEKQSAQLDKGEVDMESEESSVDNSEPLG